MHEQLKTSGIKYDFIFSDASLSIRDCHLISDILADKSNLFFMTHDVYPNKYEKGNRALDIFADNYSLEDDMYKFIPSKLDIGYEVQNTKINSCTGFVASHRCYNSIVNNLGRQNGSE